MSDTKNEREDGEWKMEKEIFPAPTGFYFPSSILYLHFFLFITLAIFISGCAPPGPRALLKGKKFLDSGNDAKAVEQFKIATTLLATNAQAWNYYGVALEHAGKLDDAADAYQNALKFDRDLVEAHYNLGCLWMEQNKFADAKTEFTAYTLRRANAPEGWLKLGLAQLRAGDSLSAEKSFSTALSLNPNNAEALNGLGLARVARDRDDDAAKFFAAAVDAHPDFAPARLNLAIADEQYLHNEKAALENYHAYLDMKPRPANWDEVNALINHLAPVKTVAANPVEPKKNEVAVAPPKPVEPARTPAVRPHFYQTPKPQPERTIPSSPPQTVRVQSEPAIVGTPRAPENPAGTKTGALHNLNPLNWFASQPKENEARNGATPSSRENAKPAVKLIQPAPPVFPRYLYLSPRKPRPGDRKAAAQFFAKAQQSEKWQQWADAMNFYEQAAAADPSWFEAQYNFGVLAYQQRDYNRALAADEMALAIRPDSADARYNFALALTKSGYETDALNELKKILAANPDDVRAHLALGNLYAQPLRDPARAREQYLKVLALDPRNPAAGDIQFWLSGNPP